MPETAHDNTCPGTGHGNRNGLLGAVLHGTEKFTQSQARVAIE